MKPSEIRDYVGREHIQLRILFTEVEHACRDLADPRRLIFKMVRAVLDHIALEDRLLVPALREVDAWGKLRADRVSNEHAGQRVRLVTLRNLCRHGSPEDAAASALRLIGELLTDMNDEETDLLHPDLLRDDLVAVQQSDG